MRRALVFILGALGARDALGLVGPKPWARGAASSRASVVAATEMTKPKQRTRPYGLGLAWSPNLTIAQLLTRLHKVDGVQYFVPKRTCKSGGGLQTGHLAQAFYDANCNMLSYYDEDDAIWLHPEAQKLKKDAVWRATHQPERREHAGYLEWDAVNRFDRCLSCDLLEFTPRPHAGYFSDVNNQDAKLARDGDFAKAESIAFMDEAIDGELKLFSVADRE